MMENDISNMTAPPPPPGATPRRVFTAPVPSTIQPEPKASSSRAAGLVETLYNHPSVKIVSFTASGRAVSRSPTRGAAPSAVEDEAGSLSWSSQLERTIAVGPFRIYRAPGSVAFLSCGSALQPILPKSQCWAIDEASSKFVLQIRRPQYWRIEIPVIDYDDQQRAELLRGVFDQILQFEKTPCPFKRDFTVELPERPQTPVKKRPWTPATRRTGVPLPTPPFEGSPTHHRYQQDDGKDSALPTPESLRESSEQYPDATSDSGLSQEADLAGSTVEPDLPIEPVRLEPSAATPPVAEPLCEALDVVTEDTEPTYAPRGLIATGGAEFTTNVDSHTPELEPLQSSADEETIASRSFILAPIAVRKTVPEAVASIEAVGDKQPIQPESWPSVSDLSPPHGGQDLRESIPQTAPQLNQDQLQRSPDISTPYGVPVANGEEDTIETDEKAVFHEGAGLGGNKGFKRSNLRRLGGFRAGRSITAPPHLTLAMSPPSKSAIKSEAQEPILESQAVETVIGGEALSRTSTTKKPVTVEIQEEKSVTAPSADETTTEQPTSEFPSDISPVAGPVVAEAGNVDDGATEEGLERVRSVSPTGSSDSFHSVQSWHSPIMPLPPSPPESRPNSPPAFPYPHDNIALPKRASHHRDVSDLTVTADTKRTWDEVSSSSEASQESATTAPDTPAGARESDVKSSLSEDERGISTAISRRERRSQIRHRPTTSISVGRRALSPLPPAANLFSPTTAARRNQPYRGRLETVRRIPMAIITKTYEVLLGPPSHLINLMLKVAARIAAGEWRGLVFGIGEGGEEIPVQWDYSDGEFSSWGDDDDYYMDRIAANMTGDVRVGTARAGGHEPEVGGDASRSWEVD